jgi:hypothetical protein
MRKEEPLSKRYEAVERSEEILTTLLEIGRLALRSRKAVGEDAAYVPDLLRGAIPALEARSAPLDVGQLSLLAAAVRLVPNEVHGLWQRAFFVDDQGTVRCDATWATIELDIIIRNHMGVAYESLIESARRGTAETVEARIDAAEARQASIAANQEKLIQTLLRAGRPLTRDWAPERFGAWLEELPRGVVTERTVDSLLGGLRGQPLVHVVGWLVSSDDPRAVHGKNRLSAEILEACASAALRLGQTSALVAMLKCLDLVKVQALPQLLQRFPSALPLVLQELIANPCLTREQALVVAEHAVSVDDLLARHAVEAFLCGSPRWLRYINRTELAQAYRRAPKLKAIIDSVVATSPPAAEYLSATPIFGLDDIFIRAADGQELGSLIDLPWDPDDPAQKDLEEEWVLESVPQARTRSGSIRPRKHNPYNNMGIEFSVAYFPGAGRARVEIDTGVEQWEHMLEGVHSLADAFAKAKEVAKEQQAMVDELSEP